MYSVICMEIIHMHYVLCYFLHKILFEEFVYEKTHTLFNKRC